LKGQGIWTANINPFTTPFEDIFNAWESDYDKTLIAEKKKMESIQHNIQEEA